MKKLLLTFMILVAPCAAQTALCDLTAPTVSGLRLGMSPAEVKTVFGKSLKLKVKRSGTFFQNFIDKSPPAFLPDVRALYVRFFETRVFQIEVFYANANGERETASGVAPPEFINRLSANFNLPAAAWKTKDGRFYKLSCADFSIAADDLLNPRVELTDEAARARFEESQNKKR